MTSQWTNFWKSGHTTTFADTFGESYEGEVLNFWLSIFDKQERNARVVDLGTGNGAIALIAANHSEESNKNFEIIGVDSADNNPPTQPRNARTKETFKRVQFLNRTPIEQTGLFRNSSDLVTSQFGLEYSNKEKAILEVSRILKKKNSGFAAILHVEGSAISEQSEEGVHQAKQCINSKLSTNVKKLIKTLKETSFTNSDPALDQRCRALRNSINNGIEQLLDYQENLKSSEHIAFFIKNLMALFNPNKSGNLSFQQKLKIAEQVEQENLFYLERMRDLKGASLAPDQISELKNSLIGNGFIIRRSLNFKLNGQLFGHQLVATR